MAKQQEHHAPWFLMPFIWLWDLLTWIIMLTGRLVAIILGLAFLIVGSIMIVTLIAAPIGIPMIIFGFLLILRGIF